MIKELDTHKANIPSIHEWVGDGVDHINIKHGKARTTLGKSLAIQASANFIHPVLGPFSSMEGFWHFVKTKGADDRMRDMHPFAIRALAKEYPSYTIPKFKEIIIDGYYYRIRSDGKLLREFLDNKLPLVTYTYFSRGGTPIRIEETRMRFITQGLADLAELMREGRGPYHPDYEEIFPHLFKSN